MFWPYLQLFFKGLQLFDDNGFKNQDTHWKAVHLLHFIVYGEETCEEHQFLLNKIICGIQPDEFVSPDISLTKEEKEECEHLIKVVIQNWKALKSTSIYGFRKTFLQREGLITKDHDGWLLKVQTQTLDVLLNRLTWPISIIKLPWNNHLIHVEWQV